MDFEFSEIAEKDLNNILSYFTEKLYNKQAARNFYQRVCDVIENIKSFPEMYELIINEYSEYKNIRRVPIDNFNLYYAFDDQLDKATIIRIIYAHYNSESIINDKKIGSYED